MVASGEGGAASSRARGGTNLQGVSTMSSQMTSIEQTFRQLERRGGVARIGEAGGPSMSMVLASADRLGSVIKARIGEVGVEVFGERLRSLDWSVEGDQLVRSWVVRSDPDRVKLAKDVAEALAA